MAYVQSEFFAKFVFPLPKSVKQDWIQAQKMFPWIRINVSQKPNNMYKILNIGFLSNNDDDMQ